MSVNFNYDVVYPYIFSHIDGFEDIVSIEKKQVNTFLNKLESSIGKRGKGIPAFKYIHFNLGDQEKEHFFREYHDYFVDMGDTVYLSKNLPDNTAKRIESKYNPIVIDSLRDALSVVRNQTSFETNRS